MSEFSTTATFLEMASTKSVFCTQMSQIVIKIFIVIVMFVMLQHAQRTLTVLSDKRRIRLSSSAPDLPSLLQLRPSECDAIQSAQTGQDVHGRVVPHTSQHTENRDVHQRKQDPKATRPRPYTTMWGVHSRASRNLNATKFRAARIATVSLVLL
jgi:hypothetical protein